MNGKPLLKQPWHPGLTVNGRKAAEMLGVSHTVVRNLCEDGTLQHFKRTERKKAHYAILRDSVIALSEKWQRQAAGEISQ